MLHTSCNLSTANFSLTLHTHTKIDSILPVDFPSSLFKVFTINFLSSCTIFPVQISKELTTFSALHQSKGCKKFCDKHFTNTFRFCSCGFSSAQKEDLWKRNEVFLLFFFSKMSSELQYKFWKKSPTVIAVFIYFPDVSLECVTIYLFFVFFFFDTDSVVNGIAQQ